MEDGVARAFESVFKDTLPFSEHLRRDEDPGWDSLKHVELLVALERQFGVRFDGADATEMNSVARVREVLHAKTQDQ